MENYYDGNLINSPLSNYSQAEFYDCTFDSLNLSSVDFKNSKLVECKFVKCNLSNAIFLNASLMDVAFEDCKCVGINWSTTNMFREISFKDCLLDYSVFQNLNLKGTHFIGSSLKEADFSDANLRNTNFAHSNLLNAVFTGSDLSYSNLTEAMNYFIEPNYTKLKETKVSLPEAASILTAMGLIVE